MKRTFAIVFSLILVVSFCAIYVNANEQKTHSYSSGDADLNGIVDMKDVLIIRKYLANITTELPSFSVLDGKDGMNGKSAYELAVENGFEGTVDKWLSSLVGSKGTNGTNGADGKSAYELAVEKGYSGSEDEWLDSLKGSNGRGIVSTQFEEGDLIVYYSDGTNQRIENVYSEIESRVAEQVASVNALVFNQLDDGTLEVSINDNYKSFVEEIIIPSSYYGKTVSAIAKNGFNGCSSLKEIKFPSSISKIGDYSFGQCESLETISIPSSVISIGEGAFINCTGLQNVIIDANSKIRSIGSRAFYNCSSLVSINLENAERLSVIEGNCYEKCTSLERIVIPLNVIMIERDAFAFAGLINAHFEDPLEWTKYSYDLDSAANYHLTSTTSCTFTNSKTAAEALVKKVRYSWTSQYGTSAYAYTSYIFEHS